MKRVIHLALLLTAIACGRADPVARERVVARDQLRREVAGFRSLQKMQPGKVIDREHEVLISVTDTLLRSLLDASFPLTVDLPADYGSTNANDTVKISVSWPVVAEDYDIYLLNAAGAQIASGATSGDPEAMEFSARPGITRVTVRIVPYAVAGGTTTGTIKLNTPAVVAGPPPTPFSGLLPRFKNETSPAALANTAGEPTMGYNLKSRNAMCAARQYR